MKQKKMLDFSGLYINNSLLLTRKYARRIFVRGHYLFREAHSFPRAWHKENCELQGTDNVQGQIFKHINFRPKWGHWQCLLSFKSFSQRAQFWKLGNILGYSWIFAHVMRLDQSRASKNIWWIIINHEIIYACRSCTIIL